MGGYSAAGGAVGTSDGAAGAGAEAARELTGGGGGGAKAGKEVWAMTCGPGKDIWGGAGGVGRASFFRINSS
jgi:hypothetical protein